MRIGIDPGLEGALACLSDTYELILLADMPVMQVSKTKNQVNAAALAQKIRDWSSMGQTTVYLEQVAAMPGQGVSSMFNFGVSYGIVQGVCAALYLPLVLVPPVQWKRRAGLAGQPKDMARTAAQRYHPTADLSLKKHVGRADALLIARFGAK